MSYAANLLPGSKALLENARNLVADISADQFARKPRGVELNHPAFNFGHLGLYPALLMELADKDPSPIKPPQNYPKLFLKGVSCQDDPSGAMYPPMKEIIDHFFGSHEKLFSIISEMPESVLSIPLQGDRATRFPTYGSFLTYILSGHLGTHLGQVSAWRRCMGLPGLG